MSYSSHVYQTPAGYSPSTNLDLAVTADGQPHGTPYEVPLTGWQSAHAVVVNGQNLIADYTNNAAGLTHENYSLDQGPFLLPVQGWVPDQDVERPSNHTDPAAAGMASPDLDWVGIYYRRGSGSDASQFLDAPGVTRQPYGHQDGSSWTYFQDEQADLAPYGSQPLTPISNDPSVAQTMPDTMRALPPQPAGGWTSEPVLSTGEQVLLQHEQMAHQGQVATSQDFTANQVNVGGTMLTRMRHVGQDQPQAAVQGSAGWWTGR